MTKIQWTDKTINPFYIEKITEEGKTISGGHWCSKVSEGCSNCYAETINSNPYFFFASQLPYSGNRPKNFRFHPEEILKTINQKKSKKIFIASMTDFAGEWIEEQELAQLFAAIALAPQHDFQLLTKRPQNLLDFLNIKSRLLIINLLGLVKRSSNRVLIYILFSLLTKLKQKDWKYKIIYQLIKYRSQLKQKQQIDVDRIIKEIELDEFTFPIWLGVTVENNKATLRIEYLQLIASIFPVKYTFLSCEPLLEEINLDDLYNINQIIIGGESGTKARITKTSWILSLIKQGKIANIRIFVKQMGHNCINDLIEPPQKMTKKIPWENFPEDLKVREWP